MCEKNLAIGIDLGGSHVCAAVLDTEANILCIFEKDINRRKPSEAIINEDILNVIQKNIDHLGKDAKRIRGIGMGIPGRVNSQQGICVFAPNLRWENVDVKTPIEQTTGLPLFILNDVRAMAVGEKVFGNGKGIDNFVCIALGTGIGGGIVIDGKLYLGADEGAGEIGHITVRTRGPKCGCGNYGCVEAFASGPAIVKRTLRFLRTNIKTALSADEIITPKSIFEAAQNGDPLALKIWEDTGSFLGIALATIVTTVNPSHFIFSGKISRAISFFLPALKRELKTRAKMLPTENITFIRAKFEDNSGVIGNAARVFEQLHLI